MGQDRTLFISESYLAPLTDVGVINIMIILYGPKGYTQLNQQ